MRSDLWRDRGFVKLWAANGISQLGTQVTLLALPLSALYVLKAGTLGVALLRAFAILPFLVFSLPAGVWIDRLRRRPLMIAADVGRALAIVSIPITYWFGHLTLVQLYVVSGVHGLLSVIFDVSYLSFLPTLVGREHLGEANSKLLGAAAASQLAGPTLAGGLVATFGAPVAVLADAASFALSGAFVGAIRNREPRPEPYVLGTFVGFLENVNQLTLRQAITPHRLLGRMNAVTRFMYWGTIPIGSALGGVIAQTVGLRATLFAAAAGSALTGIPIVLSPIRKLRDLPEPPAEPALSIEPLVRATVEVDA
ncbi:MAG TPA: MFS transporter [Gaiellaceae bacterium]|jgi:MFS family permease|nr:MFS transporter [Gaiellaceae bacterium]